MFGVVAQGQAEGGGALGHVRYWISSGKYQLVVCDEINTAAHLGIVDVEQVVEILKTRDSSTEVVLTGRSAPAEFIALADLVSSINPVKHYFDSGQPARPGIEF